MIRWFFITLLAASTPAIAEPEEAGSREKVAGIGGLFFRADAPAQ